MGTLTVQTLQAPTSGANANKVLIPSGQTLDASAGTLTPSAGHVIQYQQRNFDLDSFTTSTASYIDYTNVYVDITPKFSNSLIKFRTQVTGKNATSLGYSQFQIVDTNNSNTRFNPNTAAESSFYEGTGWHTVVITAVNTANTTSTMRLQLRVFTNTGTTSNFNWSSGDSRHVEAWEIKQ